MVLAGHFQPIWEAESVVLAGHFQRRDAMLRTGLLLFFALCEPTVVCGGFICNNMIRYHQPSQKRQLPSTQPRQQKQLQRPQQVTNLRKQSASSDQPLSWAQAAEDLAELAKEAAAVADLSARCCDGRDASACEALSREDEGKRAWAWLVRSSASSRDQQVAALAEMALAVAQSSQLEKRCATGDSEACEVLSSAEVDLEENEADVVEWAFAAAGGGAVMTASEMPADCEPSVASGYLRPAASPSRSHGRSGCMSLVWVHDCEPGKLPMYCVRKIRSCLPRSLEDLLSLSCRGDGQGH